jgi:hypothetical protein
MRLPIRVYVNLTLLILLSFSSSIVWGQSPLDTKLTLHDKLEEIGRRKKLVLSFELSSGEEVVMNVESIGKRLHSLTIDQPGSPFQLVTEKISRIERGTFVANRDGDYSFTFYNKGLTSRNVRIRIEKYPNATMRDTMILDDIIMSTSVDTVRTAEIDTTAFPDISMHSFVLEPTLNYTAVDYKCIADTLLDGDYQYAVYWIGVGEKAKRDYDELKANPPTKWVMEGVEDPLMAYGLGLTKELPESNSALARNLRYAFLDPFSDDEVELTRDGLNRRPYGLIPVYRAGRDKKIKVCFRNFNTTTRVPVYLYIAKYNLSKKEKFEITKRERVQEIFIKKPVATYPTAE